MKRTLFVVSLSFSLPILAITYEEAKQEVARAQANLDAAQKRAEELKSKCHAGQSRTVAAVGKVEYAEDMERQKEANRQTMEEYNKAVDACQAKLKELQETISRTGKEHTVVSSGGKYDVVETQKTELKPIVRTSTEGTRQPYAQTGSSYPLAS